MHLKKELLPLETDGGDDDMTTIMNKTIEENYVYRRKFRDEAIM